MLVVVEITRALRNLMLFLHTKTRFLGEGPTLTLRVMRVHRGKEEGGKLGKVEGGREAVVDSFSSEGVGLFVAEDIDVAFDFD